mmetsp:Transcript_19866/g.58636  ORF Transcript_19866/g.58636 Transcript_19866/m.58636 type:complete len:302 (-) Transcript_19866:383-1288(-)
MPRAFQQTRAQARRQRPPLECHEAAVHQAAVAHRPHRQHAARPARCPREHLSDVCECDHVPCVNLDDSAAPGLSRSTRSLSVSRPGVNAAKADAALIHQAKGGEELGQVAPPFGHFARERGAGAVTHGCGGCGEGSFNVGLEPAIARGSPSRCTLRHPSLLGQEARACVQREHARPRLWRQPLVEDPEWPSRADKPGIRGEQRDHEHLVAKDVCLRESAVQAPWHLAGPRSGDWHGPARCEWWIGGKPRIIPHRILANLRHDRVRLLRHDVHVVMFLVLLLGARPRQGAAAVCLLAWRSLA